MKKNYKIYAICWMLLFCAYNVISIILAITIPPTFSFGVTYGLINAAFVNQLICAGIIIKKEPAKKTSNNSYLLSISYASSITSFVTGTFSLLISPQNGWIGTILGAVIWAISIFSVILAKIASKFVSDVDEEKE